MEKGPLDKQTEELLTAYFRGELEGLELQRVEAWLAESEEHRQQYRRISADMLFWQWSLKEWKLDSSDAERRLKAVWNRKPGLSWKRYLTIAASVVILLFAGWWGFRHVDKNTEFPAEVFAKIEPITPRAVLVLSSGIQIYLLLSVEQITEQNGMIVEVDSSGEIRYQRTDLQSEEIIYNKVIVPRAGEYSLRLSDGTRVWLNSESELRYPVDFVGPERKVFLKGEAYFQVAKDATKPFRVMVNDMQVEALGTEFNINAYRDDDCLRTTLAEGKVRVSYPDTRQECILVAGEQAVLKEGVITTGQVNVDDIIAWKKGRFVFSDMSLEAIAHQLERWYDVEIRFDDVVAKYYRFTGVMKRYNELEQVLELIEETTNVRFKVEGRQVKVFRNL